MLIKYLQELKSSEVSFKEEVKNLSFLVLQNNSSSIDQISLTFCHLSIGYQLEKAKKKESAFIVTFAKREQEIAELKVRFLIYGSCLS